MQTRRAHDDALRALARVSLTVLAAGCIDDPAAGDPPGAEVPRDATVEDATLDARRADADPLEPVPDAAIFIDAFGDAGGDAGGDPIVDGGADPEVDAGIADMSGLVDMASPCNRADFSDFEAFWACCEANNFPPGPCTPWGPPMPPPFVAERGLA